MKQLHILDLKRPLSFSLMVASAVISGSLSLQAESRTMTLPEIPEAVTSFGAAVEGETLYIYGGHMGVAHGYSVDDQSDKLFSLSLNNPTEWQELPSGPRLQGLAMVAHNGSLYRLGGFSAMNEETEAHDLVSSAECARFDLKSKSWEPLPALPEPRSSFDAVVHNDVIYVLGGWAMYGKDKGDESKWHDTALQLDLNQQPLEWKEMPAPPFQRRALSAAALGNKIYAIGGMKPEGGPTREVDVFDLETQTWSKGPELPGEKGMEGFGNSGFSVGGDLFCSTISGSLYQLAQNGSEWTKTQDLPNKRFFHRMVPYQDNSLLFVGGASMEDGKVLAVDHVLVPEKK
ncbi:N-acetylneuraminate epimerase precursor [Polystyrenella longa]|uniref:N-acetylneuraminate epimerase n=1 Tax=Polystyrenella longa TaxID=2528007 RepID=A0A518CT50_9PLAN|nr:kelch repeat-containing protein [Polystyrenella longa]QDU82396.1 N-acetylneuraminate epimerase precursor [Polystyrenella longa]